MRATSAMYGRPAVELSVFPLFSLIRKEKLGEPHPVFAGGERYVSPRFVDEADRVVREELAGHGLGDPSALDGFLRDLAVVQVAARELYGWVINGERKYAVLVAARGRRAVAVTRAGDLVTFERIDVDQLVDEFVRRLPEVPAGDGEAISVLAADIGARRSGTVLRHARPARPDETRRLDLLLHEPRMGGAKLYAARRGDDGERKRSPEWLTVLDLTMGRWLVYPTFRRGERIVNAVPGTPRVIADRLSDLLRTAT